ncbi:hypothetical protein FGU64_04520 [Mesorhizobium sp. 8]|nr:hypothetical protein FGU64_04520 [Mesorhizobium sp. 8]
MLADDPRLLDAWNQTEIPIVLRRTGKGQRIRVRLPFAVDNRKWLKNERRSDPVWFSLDSKRYWELPRSWLNDFVERALKRYGALYIIQPYREQEICSSSCMNAAGHECECSCMGANHGAGNDGSWFEVSETFATRWGNRELACRLMVAK